MSLATRLVWSFAGTAGLALLGVMLSSAEERVVLWEDGCAQCGSTVIDGSPRYSVRLEEVSLSVGLSAHAGGVVAVEVAVANEAESPIALIPGRVELSLFPGGAGKLDRFMADAADREPTLGVIALEPGGSHSETVWFRGWNRKDQRLLVRIPLENLVIEFPVTL